LKAFVIHLADRPHSVSHATYMVDTLKSYNLDAELFVGVNGDEAVKYAAKAGKRLYPFSIKNRQLTTAEIRAYIKPHLWNSFQQQHEIQIYQRQPVGEKDYGKLSRPGVVGCFYSHYALWTKCVDLQEPIMIFEDDVKFFRGWHPVDWEGVLILSLGKSSFLNEPWKTYLENPSGNPQPVPWKNFSMPGASGYAIKPDAALGLMKFYKPYWYPADNAINQYRCTLNIHNYIMGRNTLDEEGNISMTKSKDWVNE